MKPTLSFRGRLGRVGWEGGDTFLSRSAGLCLIVVNVPWRVRGVAPSARPCSRSTFAMVRQLPALCGQGSAFERGFGILAFGLLPFSLSLKSSKGYLSKCESKSKQSGNKSKSNYGSIFV